MWTRSRLDLLDRAGLRPLSALRSGPGLCFTTCSCAGGALHVLFGISLVLLALPLGGKKPAPRADGGRPGARPPSSSRPTWSSLSTGRRSSPTRATRAGSTSAGGALSLVLLDASRRATGWAIPVCVLLMFVYVFLGPFMPGIWIHPGFPLEHVVENLYYSSSGIYGSLTGTSATFIAMFILFGAVLEATGGGQDVHGARPLPGRPVQGRPGQGGIFASAMFGMISGSAVANVSVTGAYTIPLMRKLGYDPDFAAGVEAMSSTGGGITPPVMGISAFIMAEFLGISYLNIIGYAVIPCVLFYTGIIRRGALRGPQARPAAGAEGRDPERPLRLHLGKARPALPADRDPARAALQRVHPGVVRVLCERRGGAALPLRGPLARTRAAADAGGGRGVRRTAGSRSPRSCRSWCASACSPACSG